MKVYNKIFEYLRVSAKFKNVYLEFTLQNKSCFTISVDLHTYWIILLKV